MRIALGQLDMLWEDREASLAKAERWIGQAAAQRADIIFFPEMTLTGFSMHWDRIGENAQASWTVAQMKRLAAQYGIAIGFGWAALPEQTQKKGTNRFTVVDRSGETLGEYCKLHPFRYGGEAEAYQGGDALVTVPWGDRRLGLFVCYDLRFPEIFQKVSETADVLVVIANWPASRREHWLTLLRARAIETQSYVAGINCVGTRDGLEYSGDSAAFGPTGEMLGVLHGQEGILVCELEDDAEEFRRKFPMKQDRRVDFYIREYSQKTGKVQKHE